MDVKKGCCSLNAVNAILLAALIIMAIGTIAVSAEMKPYYAVKEAEFAKSGISADQGITGFVMVLRMKNTQDAFAVIPQSSFTIYYGGEDIGSGEFDGAKIPPKGTVPFPIKWAIPESVTAGELFDIQKGGEEVRVEFTMHASVLGAQMDIPVTIAFGENEAIVS